MVRLIITPAIQAALRHCLELQHADLTTGETALAMEAEGSELDEEPEREEIGDPITHDRLIAVSKALRKANPDDSAYRLSSLLQKTAVYVDPPQPRPKQTPEFKALMARLRQEQEEQAYQRMIHQKLDDLGPMGARDGHEDEEVTFADVNRQLTLILNVIISIVFCAVAIWLTAWHWDVPTRLFASMGGSVVVGVAEVTIYAGYLRRLKQAKVKEKKKKEVRKAEPLFSISKKKQ